MPLHPEAKTLLDALAEQGMPPIECMTVPQARQACAAFVDLQPPPEEVGTVSDRAIPGPAGDIPVRIYTPHGEGPRGVLVYFHGGGWVIGDIETVDRPCRQFANAADVTQLILLTARSGSVPVEFVWLAGRLPDFDGAEDPVEVGLVPRRNVPRVYREDHKPGAVNIEN